MKAAGLNLKTLLSEKQKKIAKLEKTRRLVREEEQNTLV